MKIKELLSEAPQGYQAGKELGNKLMSPTKWLDDTPLQKNYQQGKSTMDKILSPTKWFSKPLVKKSVDHQDYEYRQALVNAGSGKTLYADDIEVLKSLYNDMKNGQTSPDELSAIRFVIDNKPLTDQQKNILLALAKKY